MTEQPDQHDDSKFSDFIRRIRTGDAAAAVELVREYEPLIRREVRLHLDDTRLDRLFDSLDICQSVLASFFLRTAAGQYDLENESQLIKLLATMARNKLASAARVHFQECRDVRRMATYDPEGIGRTLARDGDPLDIVAERDLFNRFRQCLSEEERRLAELRSEGLSWPEIAARLGGTPDARRLQLSRAVDRVWLELGLSE
ncbi:MAG TPA: ECF-type sigma factor [Planctomycetaceae bacterium]|jgi:RNA polymerase sigma-70 factor (ECF subfamily)